MHGNPVVENLIGCSAVYYIGKGILKDLEYGSSRNTVKRVLLLAATRSGVDSGMYPDNHLIEGLLVGIGAYFACDVASEVALDAVGYNMQSEHCCKCDRTFYVRWYQVHYAASRWEKCPECLEKFKQQ